MKSKQLHLASSVAVEVQLSVVSVRDGFSYNSMPICSCILLHKAGNTIRAKSVRDVVVCCGSSTLIMFVNPVFSTTEKATILT